MSEFMVQLSNIRSDAEEIKHLSAELNSCAEEIRDVVRHITFSDASIYIVKSKLYNISASAVNQSGKLIKMTSSLSGIADLYEKTENALVNDRKSSSYVTDTGDQPIFNNEDNGYGGDQGDLAYHHNGFKFPWGWVWFEDKDIYNFVRQQEGYENYTEEQIHDLLNKMNEEGCGYIGIVNAIFSEFEGSEEEFERRFGFPMRDSKGNYNYNKMFIDLYCQTDNKYYLAENGGVAALAIEIACSYEDDQAGFKEKYGVDLGYYDTEGKFQYNEDALMAVVTDVRMNYDSDAVVTFDASRDGLTPSAQENHIMAYLEAHGMDAKNISYETRGTMTRTALQSNLDNGKVTSVLILEGTEMYTDSGSTTTLDGGHYVTITGIADDGRYIVSSWGEKYYIDPTQATVANYQVIDISF